MRQSSRSVARARVFAHRLAAEEHGLDGAEGCALGEIDVESAAELCALEEDGLLRQPVEPGIGFGSELHGDPGIGAERAVDALAGLRRQDERCAGAGGRFPAHIVAAGQPAGRVDQHRLQRVVVRVGQPDFRAALLVEHCESRAAI